MDSKLYCNDIAQVSAVLNTKEDVYPESVLSSVAKFPFGEIIIKTHSTTPHAKYELFKKAKYDILYYQDDDAICPIQRLLENSDFTKINVAMKTGHYKMYKNLRMTMGLGWGAFFPKSILSALDPYLAKYGEDELLMRDTEKILTHLSYPQNRFVLPIYDLPSSIAPDRLCMQTNHMANMRLIEDRCREFILPLSLVA